MRGPYPPTRTRCTGSIPGEFKKDPHTPCPVMNWSPIPKPCPDCEHRLWTRYHKPNQDVAAGLAKLGQDAPSHTPHHTLRKTRDHHNRKP